MNIHFFQNLPFDKEDCCVRTRTKMFSSISVEHLVTVSLCGVALRMKTEEGVV